VAACDEGAKHHQIRTSCPGGPGALAGMIRPMCGSQGMRTASTTIKELEVMRVIRRNHCNLRAPGATAEIRLVDQMFGVAA
jgi:transposase, IS6 family